MRMKWVVLLVLSATLFSGCTPQTQSQYKVLSFFFDGVPNPDEIKAEVTTEEGKKTLAQTSVYKEHGPYAAKQCSGCHDRGSNRLVVPKQELCFQCHTLDIRKKYIHGPLESGGCTVCHQPHGSSYAFLLVAEPKEFCLYCHAKEDVARNPVHGDLDVQCTICHDAHGSNERYLLR